MTTCCTSDQCRKCGFGGSDLQLGCGCTLHVRCIPLNLIILPTSTSVNGEYVGIPTPVSSLHQVACPFCRCAVGGIKILTLNLHDLEKAVELRKQSIQSESNNNGKRSRSEYEEQESACRQVEAESSFLLLSHHVSVGGGADRAHHRTGRWSTEEVQFVDYIIQAFDHGTLAIPHGVKLNDFLGEILMCKSSRLTKKMKNAKLSTRSYVIRNAGEPHCCITLSNLQERFLNSVPSEASQLELRFNLTKLWRMHFSNLCLQIGFECLDASDWVSTLEQMEGKASEAEDHIRKARRRRMSLALRTDVGVDANAGVFIGGMPARDANMQPPPSANGVKVSTTTSLPTSSPATESLKREYSEVSMTDSEKPQVMDDDDEFLAALELTASGGGPCRSRLASEDMDFGGWIDDIIDPLAMMPHLDDLHSMVGNCGPFLEGIATYMEANDIPFQYADVWVPSFMGEDGQATVATTDPSKLRLFPAGHATRSDIDPTIRSQLNEFGSYSAHFSFEPGHGLPGRVYSSGMPSWETKIHECDPSVFERAGGANVYGIKTAVGVPLVADGIGRIVVAVYSTLDVAKDEEMLNKFTQDFGQWNPEPKWKLVIDLGNTSKVNKQVMASAVPTEMVHYFHPKQDGDQKPAAVASVTSLKPAPVGSTTSLKPSAVGSAFATVTPPNAVTSETSVSLGTIATAIMPNMICHDHAPAKPAPETETKTNDEESTEQTIASLLGDHMPSIDSPAAALLPHFMSLRLMLLRVRERRSPYENEKLDILKKSFIDYSKGRSGAELAILLAKDWMFLQPNFGLSESPQQALAQMPAPLPTYSLAPHPSSTMRMIVHKHPSNNGAATNFAPRSRSVSASSESSGMAGAPPQALADIVPEG